MARHSRCRKETLIYRVAAWTSVAIGITALGIYAGWELRSRYRFKRRTPYDYFAHAGDTGPSIAEYGVGI